MNRNELVRVALFCACVLCSFSPYVVSNYDDLAVFRKGMTTAEVDKIFDDDDLKSLHTFTIPNSPYVIKNTQILVQFLRTTQNNPGFMGSPGTAQTSFQSRYNTFRMLFKENKLVYWGFDYEFLQHPDPEIRNMGEMMRELGIRYNSQDD
ncbi:MAG: hypothetical protein ACK45R_02785 [Candidatus Kapaibacterium sp.]